MVRLIHADPMLMLNVSMCDTHVHIKMEVFVEFVGIEEEYQTVLWCDTFYSVFCCGLFCFSMTQFRDKHFMTISDCNEIWQVCLFW